MLEMALYSPSWDACVLRIVRGKGEGGVIREQKGSKRAISPEKASKRNHKQKYPFLGNKSTPMC
jgi:hypothetical protein